MSYNNNNNKEIIIIDSDDEYSIKPIKYENNNKNNTPIKNHNSNNINTNTNININSNKNTNISPNKNNNNNHYSKSIVSNNSSKANQNNNNYSNQYKNSSNNISKNVTKSNIRKSSINEKREFLANVHEKRLGIGKSIQCTEIDAGFFRDDNDLNDLNNKYTVKEEFNNYNNSNKTPVNSQNNIKPTAKTPSSTINNNINKTLVNNSQNNNNKQPFDYQASLNIRKEIESIRNSKHQSYRDNKLGQKKMYNLNDINQLRKNEEKEKMIAASMETTINSNTNRGIHTIDNTLLHPEAIGRKALELTNNFRKSKNLQPLIWNQTIYNIGVEHSKNMGEKLVEFGHGGFKERVKRFPFKFNTVGENVAYTNSSDVSEEAVNGWIESPGHRKNLLGNFNVCSIGVYKNSEGYWYLTQLFALQSS